MPQHEIAPFSIMLRCDPLPYVQYGGGFAPRLVKKCIDFIVSMHLRDTALTVDLFE